MRLNGWSQARAIWPALTPSNFLNNDAREVGLPPKSVIFHGLQGIINVSEELEHFWKNLDMVQTTLDL